MSYETIMLIILEMILMYFYQIIYCKKVKFNKFQRIIQINRDAILPSHHHQNLMQPFEQHLTPFAYCTQ